MSQSLSCRRMIAAAASLLLATASPALAQQAPPAPQSPTTEVMLAGAPAGTADSATVEAPGDSATGAAIPLIIARPSIVSKRDLMVTGGITVAALALFPFDERITSWVRSPERLESSAWHNTLEGAEWGVEQGSYMAGAGLWLAGLVTRNRGIAETGVHSLAAIATSQGVTKVLKGAFGRTRPYQVSDSVATGWELGGGFGSDRRSFPSGHTSHAFAFAAALSHEISHNWPRAGKVATPLLYTGATAAALARVYNHKHWASDVTVGAAVGILSARATLGYLHGRPRNLFDRVALSTRIVPQNGGALVAVTLPAP